VAANDLTRCWLVPFRRQQAHETRSVTKLIDRIRHDIQQRLDQLLAEADKLRHALAALDPRERSAPKPKTTGSQPAAKRAVKTPDAPKQTPTRTRTRTARTTNGASASTRTAPGETKAKVLAALSSDGALTAGEVANATGLARPTVSTTLSKLSKTGRVVKADRGYRLPSTSGASASAVEPATAATTADA
jgi:DNA-binding transcriptional ArsR family regulator